MADPRLSLQLYTVRDGLDADLDGTLARLAGLGFEAVEPFDIVRRADALAAALAANGLVAPTAHGSLVSAVQEPEGDGPRVEDVLDAAARLGTGIVIEPMVPAEKWAEADEVRRTAEALNSAAELAAERGLTVGYHNHSQEFHHSFGGRTAYELFASELADDVVLELDAYWAQVGAQDVPALAARLGDRLTALHVKDGSVDNDPFHTGRFDPASLGQVPAGRGAVPLAAILDAATALDYAVIEFDAFDGDLFDGIAQTAAFLAARGIR